VESGNPLRDAVLAYEKALQNPDDNENLQRCMDKMDRQNAREYEARIQEVQGQLGIENTGLKIDAASGGQRKRAALAKGMLEEPDFLILDELTNHIDLDTIEWLKTSSRADNLPC
jgi:ATP-binding cassette subfamily F protein uup